MKEYNFNEFGVCINPSLLYEYKTKNITIEFSEHIKEEHFHYHIRVSTPYSGTSYGSFHNDYTNQKEMIEAVYNSAKKWLDATIKDTSSCKPIYLDNEIYKVLKHMRYWFQRTKFHVSDLKLPSEINLYRQTGSVKQLSIF